MKFYPGLASLFTITFSTRCIYAQYNLIKDFSGTQFFAEWDFINGFDNTTNGHVNYLGRENATAAHLAYVDDAGRAVMRLDNTSFVPYNEKRNSVSIMTHDYFPIGTVFVFDVAHVPWGCSVWPALWTKGPNWPNGGEIDVLEAVNRGTNNQMTLHATSGCVQPAGVIQLGTTSTTDCSMGANSSIGCTVIETQPNNFGDGFNQAGGGVWAAQFDVAGIFIWFWSRPNVPANVNNSTTSLDTASWGTPSAAWPASGCNITEFFTPQQIVIDITLCGDFAGQPQIYQSTCGGPLGNSTYDTCYINDVINNGTSDYANAYFEINYVKAFSLGQAIDPTETTSSTTMSTSATASASAGGDSTVSTGGARSQHPGLRGGLGLAVAAAALAWL